MATKKITFGLSESDIYKAVRYFLSLVSDGILINGNQNSPLPQDKDCLVLTLYDRNHRSTVQNTYDAATQTETSTRTQLVLFQVDIYGPNSGVNYDSVLNLGQNPSTYELQREVYPAIELAEIIERGRMPFINEQDHYENRYTLELRFSVVTQVSRQIEFIDNIQLITKEVK